MARRKTPQYYYNQQKQNAKYRGIAWEMDYDEWWKIWRESGKWELRGCKRGEYCMARNGDVGTYRVGNVSIVESSINAAQGITGWPEKKRAREAQKTVDEQTNISYDVPDQTFNTPTVEIPIERFKEKKEQIAKVFSEEKKNPWSWRNIFLETFPLLKWVLARRM